MFLILCVIGITIGAVLIIYIKILKNRGGGKIDLAHSNSSVFAIGVGLVRKLGAKHVWHIREFQDLDFGIQPFCGWKRLKKMVWQTDAVVAITDAVYRHRELDNANRGFWIWDAVRSEADKAYQKEKGCYFFFLLLYSLYQGNRYGHQDFFSFRFGKGGV